MSTLQRGLNMIHVPLFIAIYYCVTSISPRQNFACRRWRPCGTRKFSNRARRALASRVFSTHGRLKNCRAIAKSAPLKFTANSVPMSRRVIDRRDFRNTKGVRAVPAQWSPFIRNTPARRGRCFRPAVWFRIFTLAQYSSRIILHENCVYVASGSPGLIYGARKTNGYFYILTNDSIDREAHAIPTYQSLRKKKQQVSPL